MSIQDIRDAAIAYGYNPDGEECLSDFCKRQFENAIHVDAVNKLLVRLVIAASQGQLSMLDCRKFEEGVLDGIVILPANTALAPNCHITLQSVNDTLGNLMLSARLTPPAPTPELALVPETIPAVTH